ncbi:JAB domain-containing protein [Pseudomonas sp. NA-150]|uniref:JAB domain-containing protein n=1 Tax=Pseudomonas sp. NA-150 TaxID=3367525 RepID=UPI0037C6CAA9
MNHIKTTPRNSRRRRSRALTESEVIAKALSILDHRCFKRGEQLYEPSLVSDYLKLRLARNKSEVFGVVFMDTKLRVLKFEVLFHGTIDTCKIYPREVVKRALALNASAVVLTHNHPSGSTDPSPADHDITRCLKQALELIDVTVIDHFIIGKGQPYSFADNRQL